MSGLDHATILGFTWRGIFNGLSKALDLDIKPWALFTSEYFDSGVFCVATSSPGGVLNRGTP